MAEEFRPDLPPDPLQDEAAPPPMQAEAASAQQPKPLPWLLMGLAAIVLVVGSALAIGFIGHSAAPAAASQLAMAPQADLLALQPTLNPAQSQGMVSAAQACQVPLGTVQIWHDQDVADGMVRIKSGNYISPPIALSSIPTMVALPYPAPYASGAGTLTVLGNAQGVELSLSPTVPFANLAGAAPVAVTWTPGNPCP